MKKFDDFWQLYTEQLVETLTANQTITKFTRNSSVIGAYAEASISELIKNVVSPMRCSTGSIISTELTTSNEKLSQLDVIIWEPTPLPAIFNTSGFALVPQQCVHGVVEVKRSAYSNVGKKLVSTLDWVESHVDGNLTIKKEVLNSKDKAQFIRSPRNQIFAPDRYIKALGVVCIKEAKQKDTILDDLVSQGRAVVLQEINENGDIRTNISHVLHLIDFLKQVRVRSSKKLSSSGVDSQFIGKNLGETAPGSLER